MNRLIYILFLTMVSSHLSAATCVPPTADGAGLQYCLDEAADGDTILLPPGTYVPQFDAHGNSSPVDPRDKTFLVNRSVTIKARGQVTLSGDLNGDDGEEFVNRSDNSYHVLLIFQGGETPDGLSTRLNGLRVTGGNSFGQAGPACRGHGGGILAVGTSNRVQLSLTNVEVSDNLADFGGGVSACFKADVTISQSSFEGNLGQFAGGGYRNVFGRTETNNSTFTNNITFGNGGAMHLVESTGYTIANSRFEANHADVGGGIAGWVGDSASQTGVVANSHFVGNTSSDIGGAVALSEGIHRLADNHFTANIADASGGAVLLQGLQPGDDPGTNDPGFYTLNRNHFTGNGAGTGGGAILAIATDELKMERNQFKENTAGIWGGAVAVGLPALVAASIGLPEDNNSGVVFNKDHFVKNTAEGIPGTGLGVGGLYIARSEGSADKLTFNGNEATYGSDTLKIESSTSFNLGKLQVVNASGSDCDINGTLACD